MTDNTSKPRTARRVLATVALALFAAFVVAGAAPADAATAIEYGLAVQPSATATP
jgi:hypothetical protein